MINAQVIPEFVARVEKLRRRCIRLAAVVAGLAGQLDGFPADEWPIPDVIVWLMSHDGWLSTMNEVDRAAFAFESMCNSIGIELADLDPPDDCDRSGNLIV